MSNFIIANKMDYWGAYCHFLLPEQILLWVGDQGLTIKAWPIDVSARCAVQNRLFSFTLTEETKGPENHIIATTLQITSLREYHGGHPWTLFI